MNARVVKGLAVAGLIGAAAATLALVSYSFLTTQFGRGSYILQEGVGFFWEADRPPESSEEKAYLGYRAPDFALPDLEGRRIALSDLRGKPVLLNFWATWCPPCRKEMPDLQRFHERYGDRAVVLGINWAEEPEVVRAFLERYGVTYLNVLDRQGKAFVLYRLTGLPTSFWIDEEGVLRGVWYGPLKTDEIAVNFAKITRAFRPERDRGLELRDETEADFATESATENEREKAQRKAKEEGSP